MTAVPTSGRVARAAGLLAGVLASTLVFLLLGEILARAIGLIDRLNVHPRELYIATDVPDLPYRLRPGFVGRPLAHREDVRINRSGTRGPELATAETATRVLVVGDSVVFGHMLDEGETFPAQLQQEMDARGADV
ncbi:MAG: hypothetical protein VX614_10605, partial [Myxococcota bacterium]|nr:hypothetical protein [Myxococcota bacterium]